MEQVPKKFKSHLTQASSISAREESLKNEEVKDKALLKTSPDQSSPVVVLDPKLSESVENNHHNNEKESLRAAFSQASESFDERTHERPKVFSCNLCHKSFSTSNGLGSHKNAHEQEPGKFGCKFCTKKFSTPQSLGGHQNLHKKEREALKTQKMRESLYSLSLRHSDFPNTNRHHPFTNSSSALNRLPGDHHCTSSKITNILNRSTLGVKYRSVIHKHSNYPCSLRLTNGPSQFWQNHMQNCDRAAASNRQEMREGFQRHNGNNNSSGDSNPLAITGSSYATFEGSTGSVTRNFFESSPRRSNLNGTFNKEDEGDTRDNEIMTFHPGVNHQDRSHIDLTLRL